MMMLVTALVQISLILSFTNAFAPLSVTTRNVNINVSTNSNTNSNRMSTVIAPPEEATKIGRKNSDFFGSDPSDPDSEEDISNLTPDEISKRKDAPMEYLEDENATRNPDDPFHILLLDTTFQKNDKITIPYVVGCLEYVLGMPKEEGTELTIMAEENGLSCLGTWEREECLSLGKELMVKDLVVRVVPFCAGGGRGWQMRNADAGADAGANEGILEGSGFD